MKKNINAFPTLGEIFREIFNSTGLLAQKNSDDSIIKDELHKKAIQKALTRLADESANLNDSINTNIDLFFDLVFEATKCRKVAEAFKYSLEDIFAQYKDLVRHEGTFYLPNNSILWLIEVRFASRIALSAHKNILRCNLMGESISLPSNSDWWLPSVNKNGSIIWPIEKVWKWIYQTHNCSQLHFHSPDSFLDEPCFKQDLENAQRWTSGKQLPTFYNMKLSLDRGLDRISKNSISTKPIERKDFYIALLVARISTYCGQKFFKSYGVIKLRHVTNFIHKQFIELVNETAPYVEVFQKAILTKGKLNSIGADRIFWIWTNRYWELKSLDIEQKFKKLDNLTKGNWSEITHPISRLKLYFNVLGKWSARLWWQQDKFKLSKQHALEFGQLLIDGLALKNKATTTLKEIETYKIKVDESNFRGHLEWLVNWNFGVLYYRQEKYSDAYIFIKAAFINGKYIAGGNLYKLTNQYVEICAKNEKYNEFKKGIAWARYLDIQVRFLRNLENPESEVSLKGYYNFIGSKTVSYAFL